VDGEYRSAKWVITMGIIMNMLFLDTVLASLFFADDNTCEGFTTKADCLKLSSLDQYSKLCVWDEEAMACEFNENIGNNTLSQFILTAVLTILTIPLQVWYTFMVYEVRNFFSVRTYNRGARQQSDDALASELSCLQTPVGTLLRAARLVKMQDTIDKVDVLTESNNLYNAIQNELLQLNWEENNFRIKSPLDFAFRDFISHHVANTCTAKDLIPLVKKARNEAAIIQANITNMSNDWDKSKYLIQRFIVCTLRSYRRNVADRFFEVHDSKLPFLMKITWTSYASLVLLPCYVIFTNFYIFLFGVGIGQKATKLWLIGSIAALALDIFILQILKLWMKGIVLSSAALTSILEVSKTLQRKARLIMTRRTGLLKNSNCAIQHLNPACRVARLNPSLPVSRLLISMNDFDFPIDITVQKQDLKSTLSNIFIGLILLGLTFLPDLVQDIVLETFITSGFESFLFVLFFLSTVHVIAALAPVLFLILIVVYFYFSRARKISNLETNNDGDVLEDVVAFEVLQHESFIGKWKHGLARSKYLKGANAINASQGNDAAATAEFQDDDAAPGYLQSLSSSLVRQFPSSG
jgi:hypothetical protein